ncbi:MAG: adenosylmethionine decarboxylase, partial [Burkholderiaceae bacterium]|nr:adenosylmethionine decarboxylase [Burkholderiaceae bacterium]
MLTALDTQPIRVIHPTHRAGGLHLIGDLHDCRCDSRLMLEAAHLEAFCTESVASAGLTAVGSLFHRFADGGGVTGMVVLAESHLSVHTWPEAGYVALDVYVCNYSGDNRLRAQQLFERLQTA